MKRIPHLIAFCLLLPALVMSCKDKFGDMDYPDRPLTLSVSETQVELDVASPDNDAVTFTWVSGSNFGTNAAVHYTFELALRSTGFDQAVQVELSQGNTAVTYRAGELNALLLDELGVDPEAEIELQARVVAEVQAPNTPNQISEVVTLTVKTYKPITPTLYLIGSAAPNGWSADAATKMNAVQGSPGVFVWQGKLNAGQFKFITRLGSFAPSYNRSTDNTSLYFRETEDDPYDEPFLITETGAYQIKVNLIQLTIEIMAGEVAPYEELWFVGHFTGWNFQPMEQDANDPFIFRYHAVLTNPDGATGEFKVGTQASFDPSVVFLRPEMNLQGSGTDLPVVSWSESENSDDYKWQLNNGTYKINLDLRENKIDIVSFTPFDNMYMVGNATPADWNIGNATPMVKQSSTVFTWRGTLIPGEIKFSADKQSDWNGAWFLASQNGIEPTGAVEQMLFSYPGSTPDNKWKINQGGTYNITLDQLKETVIFEKE